MTDEYEGLSSSFAEACRKADKEHGPVPEPPPIRIVRDHGVPSAAELQQYYEDCLRKRYAPVAASTLQAAEYLVKAGDPKRFDAWLQEHSPGQRMTIIAHIKNKWQKS